MVFSIRRAAFAGRNKFNCQVAKLSATSNASIGAQSTALYTWGQGTLGQLGHSNFGLEKGVIQDSYIQSEPRRLTKSKQFTSMAIGGDFSLTLSQSGQIFGFGKGYSGKMQSNEPVLLPLSSDVNPATKFIKIAAGAQHCAAIDSDGQLYTWGDGTGGGLFSFGGLLGSGGGQLGQGNEKTLSNPKVVNSLKEYGAKVASVVCGRKHTVVLTEDGEVLSCGVGEYGRLGTGSTSDSTVFETVQALAEEDIVQVEAGASHSLALTAEGVVYSWGRNERGQLGMKDSNMDIYSTESYPRIIEETANLSSDRKVVNIAAGEDRSAFVTADGRLYVWGARLTHFPQLVDSSLFNGLRVKKCVIGGQSSESMFAILTEDGALWTFGDRSCPMLGQGSSSRINITKQSTPAMVAALKGKTVLDVYTGLGMHIGARVVVDMQ